MIIPSEEAFLVLNRYWDMKLLVDVHKIGRAMGVRVGLAFFDEAETKGCILSNRIGLHCLQKLGDQEISIRFTLAHQLYYIHMGLVTCRLPEEKPYSFFQTSESFNSENRDEYPMLANAFALALLIPEQELADKIRKEKRTVSQLAEFFHVSGAAMEKRLRDMGYKL